MGPYVTNEIKQNGNISPQTTSRLQKQGSNKNIFQRLNQSLHPNKDGPLYGR